MHRLFVHYGRPEDPEVFHRRYVEEHVPLVADIPDVQSYTWTVVRPMGEGDVHMVAELDFADEATLKAALSSEGGGVAAQHAGTLGVTVAFYSGEVEGT